MNKRFVVRLTPDERTQLSGLVRKGESAAYKIKHANILLKADSDGPAWTDSDISEAFSVTTRTVRNVRQRLVEEGLEAALGRKKRATPPRERILDGEKEARLIALTRSRAPKGQTRWTLRLLAEKLVDLEIVESICPETVRQTLKKTR